MASIEKCAYESNATKDVLYVFCILVRLFIGYNFLMNKDKLYNHHRKITLLFISLLISFIYKFYICRFLTWKKYLRFIIIYIINVFILSSIWLNGFNDDYYNIVGVLVIIDALSGLYSKYSSIGLFSNIIM